MPNYPILRETTDPEDVPGTVSYALRRMSDEEYTFFCLLNEGHDHVDAYRHATGNLGTFEVDQIAANLLLNRDFVRMARKGMEVRLLQSPNALGFYVMRKLKEIAEDPKENASVRLQALREMGRSKYCRLFDTDAVPAINPNKAKRVQEALAITEKLFAKTRASETDIEVGNGPSQ